MAKKKYKKGRSVPPKMRKYLPSAVEKSKASILLKVFFIILILLGCFLVYRDISTGKGRYRGTRGGYDAYPGQPSWTY